MTLDFVPLKDSDQAFVAGLGPEISSQACLLVLIRPCHNAMCWLPRAIDLFLYALLYAGAGSTNWQTVPSLASSVCVIECDLLLLLLLLFPLLLLLGPLTYISYFSRP